MIILPELNTIPPIYDTKQKPVSIYSNNSPILNIVDTNAELLNLRTVSIKPRPKSNVAYRTEDFGITIEPIAQLEEGSLDYIPNNTQTIIRKLDIFDFNKTIDFYIIGETNQESTISLKIEIANVPSIEAINYILEHPDIDKIYLKSQTALRTVSLNYIQNLASIEQYTIVLETKLTINSSTLSQRKLNWVITTSNRNIKKLNNVYNTPDFFEHLKYAGKIYSRVQSLEDLSKDRKYIMTLDHIYLID